MEFRRIAVCYDTSLRPDTTGGYCLRALQQMAEVERFPYDNTYQLTREQRSGANAYDVTYGYDGVGNRLTKLEAGVTTTFTCDAANQLTVEFTPSARTTYTYDANGNTTVINPYALPGRDGGRRPSAQVTLL